MEFPAVRVRRGGPERGERERESKRGIKSRLGSLVADFNVSSYLPGWCGLWRGWQVADAMVSSGLRDAGYKYLVIDDCWMAKHRDSETGRISIYIYIYVYVDIGAGGDTRLIDRRTLDVRWNTGEFIADPKKFPSGMKALSNYVHSLGLKFGIYTAAGDKTCEGYPASLGHEEQDANLFKSETNSLLLVVFLLLEKKSNT